MCLGIPCKVLSVKGDKAIVALGSVEYEASLQLVEDVGIGDYVLLHAGFAIQKISDQDAHESLQLLRELMEIDTQIRRNEDNND